MTWNNQNCAEKGAKITLLALYEKTIYQNEKNGFCIFRMTSEDTGIPKELGYGRDHKIHFSVIGYYLPPIRNSMLALTGAWENSRYGLQFHVDSYTEVLPKTKSGIAAYLSSGLIKGIGKATADLIVARFGTDTLDVIEKEPKRLLEIKRISEKRLEQILDSYAGSKSMQEIMTFLGAYGVTLNKAKKIQEHFGSRSVDVIQHSPYLLCEISGFGFKTVDQIARNINFLPADPLRLENGILFILEEAKEMAEYGIHIEVKNVDWKQVQAKKNAITAQLVGGVTGLMKANKIQVVEGTASFASKDTLAVLKKDGTKENMTFDKIIIAAGSVPAVPPIPGVKENANCVDSTGALSFEEIPKSLLVIGGGVIGIELATAYSKFGTEVTVVEAAPKLLPMMDGELTAQLRKLMEAKGVKIMTDAKVQSVEAAAVGAKVNVEIGGKVQPFEAEKVLVAVGRRTDTEALNLDAAGIANDRGRITVNDKMETNVPNVYAIGDCLGKVMLAHVASAQGEVAAENALGENAVYNGATNPSCVYTDPEFAGVGLTEEKAKELGIAYQVGKFPLMANGKSLIMNGGVGSIKFIIGTEYKEVLGVHILGPRATDLIGECALAIGMEATVEDIIAAIHAHPTVTEAVREAALAAEKRAIHIPNK